MTASTNTTLPSETGVLIVGAGPVGLTLAGLLGLCGVSCTVVERRADHIKAPAAHVLRHDPRRVLALLGIDDAIEAAEPALDMRYITWCTTLGGPELGRLDIRGARQASDQPLERPWTNLSQNRLEPILATTVSAMSGVDVHYATQCESITQHGPSVSAVLRSADGIEHTITADWIVAADGAGSRTRAAVGAELVGHGPLGQFFMVHFRADLSPWILDRPGPIFWLMNPEASGTLIVHDVT
jgi:2,4-dichlorophenol 6-monooxygenase